ncbi:MAG: cytochrome oxidase assembly protein [Gammaproteobacteria bacterium]|nr:cytochrome oxidase assembly protein [Gammaproteobacteria bacterium]
MNVRNISLAGVIFAFVVIALGAWTRLVDAGLGCPDWPGCYGFVFFPTNEAEIAIAESRYPLFPYEIDKVIPEVVHRYFAAALGLLAIFLVFVALKENDKKSKFISCFLLFFICCQGIFGYLTVSLKLLPIIVTGHLFGGFITLSLFFYLFIRNTDFLDNFHFKNAKFISIAAFTVLAVQIFLGVWTSTNYASLACIDFPQCKASYWPEMDFRSGFNLLQEVGPNYLYGLLDNNARVAIHFTHRIWAILVIIVFFILITRLWFSKIAPLASTVGIVLLTQISLGIMNVVYTLPLYVAIAHNLVAAMLLLVTLTVSMLAWKK